MTAGRGGRRPIVLLGLALGVDLWALQTYGLGVDPELERLHRVLFAAHLPVVVVALRWTPRSPSGLARALLPSLLAVVACAVAATGAARPPSPGSLVDALAATVGGWLCVGGLVTALLARARPVPVGTVHPRTPVERLVGLAAAVLATALGLTMPATSRGLLERDQLGMLDQVHAVLTGFGDPAAVHLVVAYAALLVVLLVVGGILSGRRSWLGPAGEGAP